jgi:16S rRNA (uracil1498-N3)-methyltransferase
MKPELDLALIAKAPKHFVDAPLTAGASIALPATVAHHVGKVTRMRDGDAITLFNGNGHFYSGTLRFTGKTECSVDIELMAQAQTESRLRITLLQGLASSEKMAWVIEKATELGVSTIVPVLCQRSVAQLKDDKTEKKLAHWKNIAIAASSQCGRASLPVIADPISSLQVANFERFSIESQCAVLDPIADQKLSAWAGSTGGLVQGSSRPCFTLYIGPEGGLTRTEIDIAQQAGFLSITLGPRILRTETAGTTAIAALQAICGDF